MKCTEMIAYIILAGKNYALAGGFFHLPILLDGTSKRLYWKRLQLLK